MVGKKELGEEVENFPDYLEASCQSQLNLDKHLANVFNNDDLKAGEVVYDLIMRRFIKEKFEVSVPPVLEEMEGRCWGCGQQGEKLASCSGCQFARYQGHTVEAISNGKVFLFSFFFF